MAEAKVNTAVEQADPRQVGHYRIGAVSHVIPSGSIIGAEQQQPLADILQKCVDSRESQVVIDLAGINLLNSKNLEMLLYYHGKLNRLGGWLKVSHCNPLLRDIFRLTRVEQSVQVIEKDGSSVNLAPATVHGKIRIGDLLIENHLLSEERVDEAIQIQQKTGIRLGEIVINKGWVKEDDFLQALGKQLNIPYVSLRNGLHDPEVMQLLEVSMLHRLKMLPLFKVNQHLYLATSDAQAFTSFAEIEDKLGCKVSPVLAQREEIVKAIGETSELNIYGAELLDDVDEDFAVVDTPGIDDYTGIDEIAAESPVVNMVNSIIQRAVHDKASDIHIEPSQKACRIRFRIDGLLYEVMSPRIELHPALVSRLKVMANLDIAERRLPQDGRIQVHTQGRSVDLRFSSLPGMYGEKIVLRVLDKQSTIMDIQQLGMQRHNVDGFVNLLKRSYGLILVTGPTGSGKTTTLYSAINYINSIEKNIVTIEDPVEYQLDIVNQNPVREQIGLTFAKMLKHVLRQDPDVVMVGEIRERETAEIAVQAALTGHLVLSTLHTNDAIGAVSRLLDMGIEPYLLSSALIGVMGQRLVRSICPNCKTEFLAPPDLVERFNWQDKGKVKLAKGRGCNECYDSGYKGRLGIHELIETDGALQELIISNPSRDQLSNYMKEHQVRRLFDDGLDRVVEGKTTLEEVSRVIGN